MLKLAVSGAQGRMGKTIADLAVKDPDVELVALLEHENHPEAEGKLHDIAISTDNSVIKGCDALIEFTLPDGTIENLKACVEHKVPMIIGTTGFDPWGINEIEVAADKIPIVFASNMSIGVNILFKLIEITAGKIGANTIKINETHHIHKKDKPSGTAKTMAEIAEEAAGKPVDSVEAFREGEVIGDHDITFDSNEDILTISHHAKDRSMFAKGAITAAKFLQGKKKGLYNMQDVLGLNS